MLILPLKLIEDFFLKNFVCVKCAGEKLFEQCYFTLKKVNADESMTADFFFYFASQLISYC